MDSSISKKRPSLIKQNSEKSQINSPFRPKYQSPPKYRGTFYTQITQHSTQQKYLQNYIQGLKKQIKNALWKQQLILEYNYMPLQTIKQKIQLEKKSYEHKIDAFKQEYRKIFQNSQFTQQLTNLRQFNLKLKDKMKDFELKIEENKIKNTILKVQTDQKRQKLKQLVRYNMELSKIYVQKLGATNKEDLIKIVRANSLKLLKKRSSFQSTNNDQNKLKLLKRSESAKLVKISLTKNLFQECLDKLCSSIKGMSSSQDIQSGIYLEIMNKRKSQYSAKAKMSHRSTISNTLHQKYAQRVHKKENKHFQQNQFEIEWQIFKDLNWKQILGIVMVKDPNCLKLKHIFKPKDQFQYIK